MRKVPTCISGSAPLSERTQQQFECRFNLGLLNAYGLTESMFPSFFGEYDEHGMGRNTIGTPAFLKAQLRDRNGTVVEGAGEGNLSCRVRRSSMATIGIRVPQRPPSMDVGFGPEIFSDATSRVGTGLWGG